MTLVIYFSELKYFSEIKLDFQDFPFYKSSKKLGKKINGATLDSTVLKPLKEET